MHRTRALSSRAHRAPRWSRIVRPVAGRCFEITIQHDGSRWAIRIPEINDSTEAATRAAVELRARERIARRTGIPLGYISVWVRD